MSSVLAADSNNDIYINNTDSISDVIDIVDEGSTIYLNPGTYNQHNITVSKNLNFIGMDLVKTS